MPNDTYGGKSNSRPESMIFDSKSGKWIASGSAGTSTASSVSSVAKKATSTVPKTSGNSKVNSQGTAETEYAKNMESTLTGDLNVIPTEKTIRITCGDTISISGVGKYLSGQYYVTKISRKVSNSAGYSNSLSVSKNGFADNVKGGMTADSIRTGAVK